MIVMTLKRKINNILFFQEVDTEVNYIVYFVYSEIEN